MNDLQLTGVRPPAVAGQFYPADPEELRRLVRSLLDAVPACAGPAPKALIVPHAGYLFSGPVAASAYALLAPARDTLQRVILLGPAHRVGFEGLALPSVTAFATPLGTVPVDVQALGQLAALPQIRVYDKAHALEHSLEVQLPFLQSVLAGFVLVPLAVSEADAQDISQVLDLLWGGPETCIVVSSDLSHYCAPDIARQLDSETARAIEALAPEKISEQNACGQRPICGLLQAARRRGLRARTLDLRNSGDTGGPRHQVVGYGAFAFDQPGAGQAVLPLDGPTTQA